MQQLVNVVEPRLQKSPNDFLELLKEKVLSHVEWEDIEERPAKKKRTDSGGHTTKHGRSRDGDSIVKGGGNKRKSTESHGDQPRAPPKIDRKKGGKLICYNCEKPGHPVFACPDKLSKAQVAQVLKERRKKNKEQKKSDYVLVCRMARSSEEEKNRVMAKISEGSFVPAILDSGTTEVCIISRTVANEAIKKSDLKIEKLDPPVKLRLGGNETEVESTDAVTADIRLKTKAGELITRKNRCLIWDVPSDEIILGGDLLKQLGIDPHTALDTLIIDNRPNNNTEVNQKNEDLTEEYVEEIQPKLPSVCEEIDIGVESPEEIEISLPDLIRRAADNGKPADFINTEI
jgi:hypothetical protein